MSPILTGIIASGISGHLTPAWSPEGAYDSLATVTVPSGGVTSVTFSSIPTGYKHLQIRYIGLSTSTGATDLKMNFNSDTTGSYAYHGLYGTGAAASALTSPTSYSRIILTNGLGNSSYSNMYYAGIVDVLDYANVSKYKTTRALGGFDTNNATTNVNNETIVLNSGLWMNTSAINSITFAPDVSTNIAQHSQFALYGVK